MVRRVAFGDGDENAAAGIADLAAGDQLGLDSSAVIGRFDHAGSKRYRPIDRCRPQQLDVELSRYRARCRVLAPPFHKVEGRRPVRMAIKKGADDSAVQHAGKCLMVRLGVPLGDKLVALLKTPDMKPFLIRRAAAKADPARRIYFLYRSFAVHSSAEF